MSREMINAVVLVVLVSVPPVLADDWPQFRGPGGAGVAPASSRPPTTWDGKTNIVWKTPLPGPGASSPVTFGKHAYLTCYKTQGPTLSSSMRPRIEIGDALGTLQLELKRPRFVCLRSTKTPLL